MAVAGASNEAPALRASELTFALRAWVCFHSIHSGSMRDSHNTDHISFTSDVPGYVDPDQRGIASKIGAGGERSEADMAAFVCVPPGLWLRPCRVPCAACISVGPGLCENACAIWCCVCGHLLLWWGSVHVAAPPRVERLSLSHRLTPRVHRHWCVAPHRTLRCCGASAARDEAAKHKARQRGAALW